MKKKPSHLFSSRRHLFSKARKNTTQIKARATRGRPSADKPLICLQKGEKINIKGKQT
jgi:hypothetical protein